MTKIDHFFSIKNDQNNQFLKKIDSSPALPFKGRVGPPFSGNELTP